MSLIVMLHETREERPIEAQPTSGAGRWFHGRLPLESETTYFDIILTVSLLYLTRDAENRHGEANPIARFFLNHWGLKGLVYYKMALVAFVCVIAQVIARQNLKLARRLMYGLTAIVAAVVVYSMWLLARAV